MAQVITQHLLSEQEANTTEAYLEAIRYWSVQGGVKRFGPRNNVPLLIHTVPSNCLFDDISLSLSVDYSFLDRNRVNGTIIVRASAGPVGDKSPREIRFVDFKIDKDSNNTATDWVSILSKFRLKTGFSLFLDGYGISGIDNNINMRIRTTGHVERVTEVP